MPSARRACRAPGSRESDRAYRRHASHHAGALRLPARAGRCVCGAAQSKLEPMVAPLSQVLLLLAGSVLLVTLARRLGLPTTLAYLALRLLLRPHALGVGADPGPTRLLAELGVAFLLFTLGLEFSLPRMLAMRGEVFGLGAAQVGATAAVFALIGWALG